MNPPLPPMKSPVRALSAITPRGAPVSSKVPSDPVRAEAKYDSGPWALTITPVRAASERPETRPRMVAPSARTRLTSWTASAVGRATSTGGLDCPRRAAVAV